MPEPTEPNDKPEVPVGGTPLFAANEKIAKINVAEEIKNSFLDYSMSVIISRALPDVRDGLKPSQRRILYAMNDLGVMPNRKHLKCAKIVRRNDGQLPSARRPGDLSDAGPHGAAVGDARAAGGGAGELRLRRRRSAGVHAVHRSAPGSARARC